MATIITAECINCGACEPECPQSAIKASDEIYVVDPALCCECVGYYDEMACAAVCPVDCCVVDPAAVESREVLIARAKKVHPEKDFGDNFPSHI